MISSYRLGDLILLELTKDEKKLLCCEQPYSMGAYYLSKYNHLTDIDEKITAFTNIVLEFIEKYDFDILLDYHRTHASHQGDWSETNMHDFIDTWITIIDRYKNNYNNTKENHCSIY